MPETVASPVVPARVGAARQDFGASAQPFRLGVVELLPGPFHDDTSRVHAGLKVLDPDRLLHTFRRNVGLPSEVVPCGGWEKPGSERRGRFTGHVLSALAQAFATTGDPAFSVRANYLVQQLALCQDRARIAGYSTGYLAAFPERFIGRAETRQPVRAPYSTLHKIMAGLLDVHVHVGNAQALTVLTRMAAWAGWRSGRLSPAQRQDVLATGSGGMNEVLANLYQLTGDPAFLTTARNFDHAEVFDPLALGTGELNQAQVPMVVGAIREYHATGMSRYLDIARNSWHPAADTCCATYNMLELTRQLFRTDPGDARYFDYYEKALHNHLGGTRHCYKGDFTCCHGTGMEISTKHGDSIYFHAVNTLYVNLFIPSVLTWADQGVSVRQSCPEPGATRLTITGSGRIDLRLRVPSQAVGARLLVNGVAEGPVTPGTYASLDRQWASGDVVDLHGAS